MHAHMSLPPFAEVAAPDGKMLLSVHSVSIHARSTCAVAAFHVAESLTPHRPTVNDIVRLLITPCRSYKMTRVNSSTVLAFLSPPSPHTLHQSKASCLSRAVIYHAPHCTGFPRCRRPPFGEGSNLGRRCRWNRTSIFTRDRQRRIGRRYQFHIVSIAERHDIVPLSQTSSATHRRTA